jgi:hypothetical protein
VNGLFALTPCVPLSRRAGEGERAAPLSHAVGEGLGVRAKQRALPANSEPKRYTLTPCVPLSRRAGEGEPQGALPCAPTPLAHAVGEGLGVRAKQRALPANSEPKRYTLTPCVPLSRRAGEGELQGAPPCAPTPLSHCVGKGLGVRAIRRGILSNIYRAFSVRELPPSLRFPPLRKGNRRGAVWLPLLREGNRRGAVPPARRGNLKEGVLAYPCLHKLWLSDWYHTSGGRYSLS